MLDSLCMTFLSCKCIIEFTILLIPSDICVPWYLPRDASVGLFQPKPRDEQHNGQNNSHCMQIKFCGVVNFARHSRNSSTSLFASWNCQSDFCAVLYFNYLILYHSSGTNFVDCFLSLRSKENCAPTGDLFMFVFLFICLFICYNLITTN